MSSTSTECLARIDAAVAKDDDRGLLEALEKADQIGELGYDEILLEAVVLLLPPFADYTRTHTVLKDLWGTAAEEKAAIWDGYRYTTVQPDDSSFMQVLARYDSAECLYMRAQFYAYDGDTKSAIQCNDASIEKMAFPNNLKLKLRMQQGLPVKQRTQLIDSIAGLVEIFDSERTEVLTGKDLYAIYWKELILGAAMSTVVWEEFKREFAT